MKIKESEHVFIAGKTGSGKSVLAEIYLAGYNDVIKLDTKGEYHERKREGKTAWYGLEEGKDYQVIERFSQLEQIEKGKVIYAPVWEENNPDFYNKLFEYVFYNGHCICWIDEFMTVTENANVMPPYLRALYTAGRSREAVCWTLTQRPLGVPSLAIANTTHFFTFSLPQPQDRKKMYDVTGCPELMEKPPLYYFWYCKDGDERAVLATLKF